MFYTNVKCKNGKILFRGREADGSAIKKTIQYRPTFYLPDEKGAFLDFRGKTALSPMQFSSIAEANDFLRQYKDIPDFKIFGNAKHDYAYLSEMFGATHPKFDITKILIANIDIEVGSENGFPDVDKAIEPITSIVVNRGPIYPITVFAYAGDYDPAKNKLLKLDRPVDYRRSKNEVEMLRDFLSFWCKDYPDIVTGWNINFFDIPYLLHRIKNLLGEEQALKMSPWKNINGREVTIMGRKQTSYELFGINTLDYQDCFKKFSKNASQESYSLDFISTAVTGEGKLDYSKFGNIHNLWKVNHQVHIEYNISDTIRVEKIDDKEKLLALSVNMAYEARVNINDVFSQVRMWTQIIRNDLAHNEKKFVLANTPEPEDTSQYEGAFVKMPIAGMHNHVASGDFTSLYPHLIMGWNISPDTILEPEDYPDDLAEWKAQNKIDVDACLDRSLDTSILKKYNLAMTPNMGGQFFRRNKQGFLARILERMFLERDMYKKKMIEAEKAKVAETDPVKKKEFERLESEYENFQATKKVCLNSAYGALGNTFFFLYDPRQAEGVTLAGQLAIRSVLNDVNDYMNAALRPDTKTDYIITADTDSLYLNMDDIVRIGFPGDKYDTTPVAKRILYMDKVWKTAIQPVITNSCKSLCEYVNCFDQTKLHMKREILADRGVWTGKKYYILNVYNKEGVQYDKPKVVVKGMASQRTTTPKVCRDKLKKAWEIILSKGEPEIMQYIADFKEEFYKMPVEKISSPRGVNGLSKYAIVGSEFPKGTPIHVRAAITYNMMIDEYKLGKKYDKIKEGEKIKFFYLKEPNPMRSYALAYMDQLPEEFLVDIGQYIDYDKQFTNTFLEPVKACLDVIGWQTEKQSTLWDNY